MNEKRLNRRDFCFLFVCLKPKLVLNFGFCSFYKAHNVFKKLFFTCFIVLIEKHTRWNSLSCFTKNVHHHGCLCTHLRYDEKNSSIEH